VGAALTAVTLLACLLYADFREGRALSLQQLAHGEAVLMSCARTDSAPSHEPLWCTDTSSPLCLPALPGSQHIDLWDSPPAILVTQLPAEAHAYVWLTWPRPQPTLPPVTRDGERIERPPRA
jgi:hypothetical protein